MIQVYQKPLVGKNIGVVFGSFAPLHQGHLDAILRAKKENDGGCLVVVCGFDGDKGECVDLPMTRRYRYVREFFSDDPLINVCGINETITNIPPSPHGWDAWLNEFFSIYETMVLDSSTTTRMWYVGDKEYYDDLTARNESCTLLERSLNPICATMIRQNPIKYWDMIAKPFKRVFSTNILIAGTASEGKTTLVQDLGKYFGAPTSYEFAREYIAESCLSELELDLADYLAFLDGQYCLNKNTINSPANHGIFFADTDSMTTKMYAELASLDPAFSLTMKDFEKIELVADEYTSRCKWDTIFLFAPHNNFVDDHVRYMGHASMEARERNFSLLTNEVHRSGNWDKVVILNGTYYENFIKIVEYVKGIYANGKS